MQRLLRAYYGAWLTVSDPGQQVASELARLATYRRRGRVPEGEDRVVPWFRTDPPDAFSTGQPVRAIWVPRGLLGAIRRLDPSCEVVNRTTAFSPVGFGWRGQLRPEQAEAVRRIVKRGGGVLVAPPGIGKSRALLAIAASFQQPFVWLTHTKRLAYQARKEAEAAFALPRRAIGYIGEGKESYGSHMTIALVQSLDAQPDVLEKIAKRVGAVAFDEVHHGSSRTNAQVLSALPARYRFGATATDDRMDGLEGLFKDLMGGVAMEVSYDWAWGAGRLARPRIVLVPTGFCCDDGLRWDVIQRARAEDPSRNHLIAAIAAKELRAGHKVAIVTELKRHARHLAAYLQHYGVPAFPVEGGVASQVRDRAFQALAEGKLVLIATKLFDEGVDVPPLDRMILAAPARGVIMGSGEMAVRLRQQIGRIMRTFQGKGDAVVYDLCDYGSDVLARQADQREGAYRALGLVVELMETRKKELVG